MDAPALLSSVWQPLLMVPIASVGLIAKASFFIGFAWHMRPSLSQVPGPKLAALSRQWSLKAQESCNLNDILVLVNKEHGRLDGSAVSALNGMTPYNIASRTQYLIIDLLTKIHMGFSPGCVATDTDVHDLLNAVQQRLSSIQPFSAMSEIERITGWAAGLPISRNALSRGNSNKTGIRHLQEIVVKTIKERSSQGIKEDAASFLLQQGLSEEQITSEIISSILTGSTLIPTIINSTLLAIITNPVAYQMLTAEIRSASTNGTVSEPIQDFEYKQLPYLQACVLEGLRKHPPTTQLQDRIVPNGGDYIGAFRIPAGTTISFNVWGTQLDKRVYGPDADVFRPSRWLTDNEHQLKQMYKTHRLIFADATNQCFSMDLAMMIVHKVLFEIFRNFDVAIANPFQPWSSSCHGGAFFQKDMNVYLTPVSNNAPPSYESVRPRSSSSIRQAQDYASQPPRGEPMVC